MISLSEGKMRSGVLGRPFSVSRRRVRGRSETDAGRGGSRLLTPYSNQCRTAKYARSHFAKQEGNGLIYLRRQGCVKLISRLVCLTRQFSKFLVSRRYPDIL